MFYCTDKTGYEKLLLHMHERSICSNFSMLSSTHTRVLHKPRWFIHCFLKQASQDLPCHICPFIFLSLNALASSSGYLRAKLSVKDVKHDFIRRVFKEILILKRVVISSLQLSLHSQMTADTYPFTVVRMCSHIRSYIYVKHHASLLNIWNHSR